MEPLDCLDVMISAQQVKVAQLADRLQPGLTAEDLRNPQDFVNLRENSHFNYEDGVLTGLMTARTALSNSLNFS
jgi:hypothetical protein